MRVHLAVAVILCACLASSSPLSAREKGADDTSGVPPRAAQDVYKRIGDVELGVWIFSPPGHTPKARAPAVVFFFGGGWRSGTQRQFVPHCELLASRGAVAIAADYRVQSRHASTVAESVADAKSAIRWVRAHADRLGIDPRRIVAAGGSAGGHLAAAAGLLPGLDDPGDDRAVSPMPNALVLFNPVVSLTTEPDEPGGVGVRVARLKERLGAEARRLSPAAHVRAGLPPTLILHGKSDGTVPFVSVESFAKAMREAGNRCELVGYEGAEHGFFNHGRGDGSAYDDTVGRMTRFLESLGFLEAPRDQDEAGNGKESER